MIVITGAAGFIGSCMVAWLNEQGYSQLILVDDFSRDDKRANWATKQYKETVHRMDFREWLQAHHFSVDVIFHLGARTDTTEQDTAIFQELNLGYTQWLWQMCAEYHIPLIYASSAATYGNGEHGYTDRHDLPPTLLPMNPYGHSKNDFDIWALQQPQRPPHWYGLKFFNVYGPNEYHKGRMASVIFHTFRQIKASGAMKLFRSHRPDYQDGEQSRDFIYVKDVVRMMAWLWQHLPPNGLYNIGTGKAHLLRLGRQHLPCRWPRTQYFLHRYPCRYSRYLPIFYPSRYAKAHRRRLQPPLLLPRRRYHRLRATLLVEGKCVVVIGQLRVVQ
ncbi:MAG: ADP-glyceromanno-heptose 6-epimerase [Saprospiraceae bacterium]